MGARVAGVWWWRCVSVGVGVGVGRWVWVSVWGGREDAWECVGLGGEGRGEGAARWRAGCKVRFCWDGGDGGEEGCTRQRGG